MKSAGTDSALRARATAARHGKERFCRWEMISGGWVLDRGTLLARGRWFPTGAAAVEPKVESIVMVLRLQVPCQTARRAGAIRKPPAFPQESSISGPLPAMSARLESSNHIAGPLSGKLRRYLFQDSA